MTPPSANEFISDFRCSFRWTDFSLMDVVLLDKVEEVHEDESQKSKT